MGFTSTVSRSFRGYPSVSPIHFGALIHLHILLFRYFYSGSAFAVTELDGIRIIGSDVCDFIQKVPCKNHYVAIFGIFLILSLASSVSVFRPGSTSPSAILYDACESFSHRSPKADESIRSIRPELAAAVDECIDAAGHEWEPHWQRQLLNVSSSVALV